SGTRRARARSMRRSASSPMELRSAATRAAVRRRSATGCRFRPHDDARRKARYLRVAKLKSLLRRPVPLYIRALVGDRWRFGVSAAALLCDAANDDRRRLTWPRPAYRRWMRRFLLSRAPALTCTW